MPSPSSPRIAWGITGSGHYLKECLELIAELKDVDLFLSSAAYEVIRMYHFDLEAYGARVFRDQTASAVPVGFFYEGNYHTVVIAPATSNSVAKCVWGISDTLVTNIYAQAGKCRIPAIVFACDTEPALISDAPGGPVMVYPRAIDLENTERLKTHALTQVVTSIEALKQAIATRLNHA